MKSQLSDQKKLQQQHEWKLSQADDNLEMVERENEKMERKAVGMSSYSFFLLLLLLLVTYLRFIATF